MGQIGRGFDLATNLSTLYTHIQRPGTTTQQYGNTDVLLTALMTAASDVEEIPVRSRGGGEDRGR